MRSQKHTRKSARFEPYGRPRASEAPRSGLSRSAHIPGVTTRLLRELLSEAELEAPKPGPSRAARVSGVSSGLMRQLLGEDEVQEFEAEPSAESEYSMRYSEDVKPKDYDALSFETTKGVATPDDLDIWTLPAAQFIRSEIGTVQGSDDWIGQRPLGEGGFGLAGLWERLDEDGTAVDVSGKMKVYWNGRADPKHRSNCVSNR